MSREKSLSRRGAITTALAALCCPAVARANVTGVETTEVESDLSSMVRRNISSFRTLNWQPYFQNLKNGAILVDITSRALHYWNEEETIYRLYPTSVPLTEDLTRRGRTKVTRKVEGPGWRPTPAMLKRNPEWPEYVPPGPDNPLGTHALYLSWTYYRVHGTHDTRKIGRRSSNGCVGLYNQDIAQLFAMAKIGTQVLII